MKNRLIVLSIVSILAGIPLSSCATGNSSIGSSSSFTSNSDSSVPTSGTTVSAVPVSSSAVSVEMETPSGASHISLSDGASTSESSNVTIDNALNQITISSLGTYYLTGSLSNGNILITASKESSSLDTVTLILNGVSIAKDATNNIYGPIYSSSSSKLALSLIEGSTSIINDERDSSADTDDNDDNAAIFSNKKLTLLNKGSLYVTSSFNNGLGSDSKIRIKESYLKASAPNNVLKAHDSIILGQKDAEGSFYLTSTGSDGAAIRVDEVDSDVTTPTYGNSETDDEVAGIEIKDGYYEISSNGKGISSEGYTYMEGGNGSITSSADKGVKAELDLYVDGGNFSIKTLKDDCLHSSTSNLICNGGSYSLTTGTSDSCQGLKGEEEVIINGGYFKVNASNEGIAAHKITANGGTTVIYSADDGWSAGGTNSQSSNNCLITITGGNHYVYASGDGLDSNGNIVVSGGTTIVSAPSNGGNGPLDFGDGNYSMSQSGGILVAYGTSGMAVGATEGSQGSVLLASHSSVANNAYLVFKAGSSYYAVKTTRAATTTYASFPEFVSGGAYSIGYASSISGATTLFEEGQLYSLASEASGTSLASGTFSTLHVSSGSSQGGGQGGGGNPGGGGGPGGH